ncbi:hypothetical protein MMC14_006646 [Varicellaria rhodocarpa]|nr:hypothetical protein [Varicellaria rhodocarpa]
MPPLPHLSFTSTKIFHWCALIRTHHIRSRKKIAHLKSTAEKYDVHVLVRNGAPGIMYVEGEGRKGSEVQEGEEKVRMWVETVKNLHYQDFHIITRPTPLYLNSQIPPSTFEAASPRGRLEEVFTIERFAMRMKEKGLWKWWKMSMGWG